MTNTLLVRNVRPMGGESVDVLVREGYIEEMAPDIRAKDDWWPQRENVSYKWAIST